MFLRSTSVEVIGWLGENGAMNRRIVGEVKWKRTKKTLISNILSLRCSLDIQLEFREEIQAGNTIMGVIKRRMIFKVIRSPKKYVLKRRAASKGWAFEAALVATPFRGQTDEDVAE